MARAVRLNRLGGPEVLRYVEKPEPSPGPGQLLIKVEAIGVNYIDTYFRSGGYPRETPFILGADEYFVLGDNSPVSNDSRFWTTSPVVRRELFLGKPFLVHLPGQVVPLKVFGRSVYWVPDPREIRYIR